MKGYRQYCTILIVFILFLPQVSSFSQETGKKVKSPVDVIKEEVKAYNARDIDGFLATYAPDAKIYLFPDNLIMSGHEEMRTRYKTRFDSAPNLHCEIVNRIVLGDYVIDREKITGIEEGKETHAVLIYEIKEGLIQKAWIMREQ